MKSIIRQGIYVLFILIAAANLYLFVAGMYLSDDINRFDNSIKKLTQENLQLEKEVYQVESLQYAASLSAHLDFTEKSQPVYFENLKYAFNR
ncbi:hypothetical protein A2334_02115 [Candidatus Roizmanbacteria bacterium RIFOXYB2_FULL_38_10]|uniref:Uncharacterized protein n=1 Tax=Candidatus Roizmanbacteria bacterium RIFOXYD1_FULL_38_12 TaxID=1802093 RepID=A0A1F7L0D1_9BACT|nr:MAG: hypothetical protein A3K47_01850 [Candidatus Roizmanbacteria bacterium RIFOXYA2_FULL_38_14]OGK63523.1 MAG: hypothetical protein A3K27_01850 [Candidatus Roizmanbacteria bacterium RIFOXYA1_FULL_37_12]OGK65369.1 MAG: hypothetical protein A3K38_01850 [Candidatus Roizmanbacteria bacterium RIFOXYB1_FULL_40_23]OGK67916.1 MAG: hypothetical protein A2334_02115 [Candidatus Roizmanbacteria bacterium RIFOXYB2_FULL_38_10]OGK69774.1 MAG: hypothetical protein A3K21_01855 [Candidatus Roizmanbacteria ba